MIPIIILTIQDDNDRNFMTSLYLDYYGLMRKHALLIVKDGSTAEDMIHDACVQLIKNIATIRSLKSCVLPAYLVSTIRRVSLNYAYRNHGARQKEILGLQDEFTADQADITADVEEIVLRQLNIEHLEKAISKLPQSLQDALNFKYLLGMTDEEIAQSIGVRKDSVRQYLTRARRKALVTLQKEEA
ncbi:MAG: sigma-70 family RNA polymerase sigma factor [Bacillota bacterium]